jgi:hypothetical protein
MYVPESKFLEIPKIFFALKAGKLTLTILERRNFRPLLTVTLHKDYTLMEQVEVF